MDPIDREVIALRHFEELSNDEVAAVLGLTKAAASKRYVRAMLRLKAVDRRRTRASPTVRGEAPRRIPSERDRADPDAWGAGT